jgi:hypothetical protein
MTDATVVQISILVIPATVSAACSWIAATCKPANLALAIQAGAFSAFLAIMGTVTALRFVYPPPLEKLSPSELFLVFTVFFGILASIAGAAIGAAVHRLMSKSEPKKGELTHRPDS